MSKTPEELAREVVEEQDDDKAREMERKLLVQTDNSPREDDPDFDNTEDAV